MTIRVAPAIWAEVGIAAELLAASAAPEDRSRRRANFFQFVESGQLDCDSILLAHCDGVPCAVAVVQLFPTGTAVVVPPLDADGPIITGPVAEALAIACVERLNSSNSRVGQIFLDASEVNRAEPFLSPGFQFVTSIDTWLCECDDFEWSGDASRFEPADETTPGFGECLLRTYQGSLDVPEVHIERRAEDVLTSYRAGQTGPPRWWLQKNLAGNPVGVLLLAEVTEGTMWEIAYLGMIPEARGQGLGGELVRWAKRETNRADVPFLSVSADARNAPALSIYLGNSFRSYRSQRLYLWRPDRSGAEGDFFSGRADSVGSSDS